MTVELAGTWKLVSWRRVAGDGTVSYPLGEHPSGLLVYTPDGTVAVTLATTGRQPLPTGDPLGGAVEARAEAYSTCMSYVGSYEVQGDSIVHTVDVSSFPNWSGTEQRRAFTFDGQTLVLRTQPMETAGVTTVSELSFTRDSSHLQPSSVG